jgi:hypothetical protein
MSVDLALVSEADPEQRDGQLKTLLGVGYQSHWAPTPTLLEQHLLGGVATTAATLLLVVDVVLAKACASAIEHNASQRRSLRLSPISVVLVFEPNTLTTVTRPALSSCEVLELSEKPLSLTSLRDMAVRSRLESRRLELEADRK